MPPFVGRKRRSTSPIPTPQPSAKRARTKPAPTLQRKVSRFSISSDSDSSSLSDVDSDEFEDIPKTASAAKSRLPSEQDEVAESEEDDDEDIEWEDAPAQSAAPDFSNREFKDIKITVDHQEEPDYTARPVTKKGPSKREKQSRLWAHQMHVQFLLWHNAKRNEWINDQQVHEILLRQLPTQITNEVQKWKRASGLLEKEIETATSTSKKKKKVKKWKANGERNERDWGRPSERLDQGKPDMSSGDRIITLLKVLSAYWKKRFAITAPGLRKRGYGSRLALRKDIESYRNDKHHPAKHGEKIEDLNAFRKLAEKCEGSRDLGAQLFTALLRALGIEARLVASLQPAGLGFTKAEEMVTRRIVDPESSSLSSQETDVRPNTKSVNVSKTSRAGTGKNAKAKMKRSGGKSTPIDLDSDDDKHTKSEKDDDNESVIDVTPTMPKARPAKYDRDLLFPIYWTEAVSPITSKVYPVSPLVLENAVATSPEVLSTFEPRGAKAEKTRQVMAYVVAFSPDYSAKDVTVRYLRKNLWPGKTKGFRVPLEKVPIYDKRGKVKRYEEYDWFKHVLSSYGRSDDRRTTVDDVEDATDLVPAEPEKKQFEGDTLQSLKSSSEFVIERHLRREEALIPQAEHVRHFTLGKGDKEEMIPVYKRQDVRRVMTAESWHKEGRAPKEGEAPMKLAPVRAVTLARKREAEQHLIRTGEKQMQGLYSQEQTDWIIPPPIEDGRIPKNAYGNIDCFVPSMVPKGATHLPLKGSVRVCKKLGIDFAEAVVGFEFGNKMAVPVIHGVVIAKENEKLVRDAWRAWNEEQRRKEESKMEKLVLEMWRKMVIGLRIRDRVQEEYGLDIEPLNLKKGFSKAEPINVDDDNAEENLTSNRNHDDFGGGFLVDHEDEHEPGGELTLEHNIASQQQAKPTLGDDGEPSPRFRLVHPVPQSVSTMKKDSPRIVQDRATSASLNDGALSDQEDITGGFLQDIDMVDSEQHMLRQMDNETSPSPSSSSSSSPPTDPELEDDFNPRRNPRPRSQPRKAATERSPKVPLTVQTRRVTPARGVKARIHTLAVSNSTDSENSSSSNDSENDPEPPSTIKSTSTPRSKATAKAKATPTRSSTRRTRGKATPAPDSASRRGKRLLRKQSTVVTSPYFDGE